MTRRSKAYLRHVRQTPCLACRSPYPSAHHLQRVGGKGMALKTDDKWAVPLCHTCHMDLHQGGRSEDLWWALKGIDPVKWAKENHARFQRETARDQGPDEDSPEHA